MTTRHPDAALAALRRWTASGGHWAVLAESGEDATVGLYTCDGGEEMERLTLPSAMLPREEA